jgi:membrane-associated phospholipid phosphatase
MRSIWILLIIVAGGVLAFALDIPAYHFVDNYLEPYEKAGWYTQIVFGFQDFAQTIPPLAIIAGIWCLDRRHGREMVIRMFLAFVMTGAASGIGKLTVGRYRPEHFKGQTWGQTWVDVGFDPHRPSKEQSFFSGHSAAAFSMATMMSACYPPLRPVVYVLATGCAASRVVTEHHWMSDVYIGSLSGIALGWLFLPARLRRGRRDKGLLQGKLSGQLAGASSA